ncbi:MAG: Ig-like domain-containing protein, partial [Ignavibacteria bacterium]|nr:Ig-like domain-containing protein [Ignavibacteria bacterium]
MEVNQATFISGTVSYSGTTATFVPLINLKPNTTYTATITTGARDLEGNTLTDNHVWNFTTVVPYTVSLSSNPLAGGITSGGGTFNSCSSVTVTATPNANYSFTNWTENGLEVSTNANYTFTLNGNRSLVANFALNQYTVTLSRLPLAGGTTNGGGTFNSGANVTVTATPNVGYSFTNRTENGNIVSTNSKYRFVLSGNRSLVANFAVIPQYTVTLSSNPLLGGSTSGGGTFNSGASVTVIATANAGYTFTNWTENGNPVSTNSNYTFVINGNRTLVANFDVVIITQFSVSLSSNPALGGTTNGGGNYNSGSNVTVTATPAVGYVFNNWTEAGNPVSTNASYTFVILANRTLVANFTALPSGPAGVNLGSAGDFAILAGSGVTSTGFSTVYGDVGSFPTATINGFPPGVVIGTLYVAADPIVGLA